MTLAALAWFDPAAAQARPGRTVWSAGVGSAGVGTPTMIMARDGAGGLYVAETIDQHTVSGTLVSTAELDAYSETGGLLLWRKPVTISNRFTITGITTVSGLVVISANSLSTGFVVQAFSASTGAQVWSSVVAGGGAQVIAAAGPNLVAAGSIGNRFHARAYSASGVLLWQYTDPPGTVSGATAIAADASRVVVGGFPGFVVRAFDASGGSVLFSHADASTLGQVFDLALDGTLAHATGQGIAGTPLVRGYDLAIGQKLWDGSVGTGSGSGRGVAVLGASVVATGSMVRTTGGVTTADLFVELRDAKSGARRWIKQVDAGGSDIGSDIAIQGKRVYVAGALTTASGDQDLMLRAYGLDGYLHWEFRPSTPGNSSVSAVLATPSSVLMAGYQPAAGQGNYFGSLAAFEATAAGPKDLVFESICQGQSGETAAVPSVASLPGQAFSACQLLSLRPPPSTVLASNIQTGLPQWSDAVTLSDGSPVFINEVAATTGFVFAVGTSGLNSATSKAVVRAYASDGQGGSAKILWTDVVSGLSEGRHVAAGGGFAVASVTQNDAQVAKAYDLSVSASNACWTHLDDSLLGKPCVRWVHVRPEYTRAGVVTIFGGRAAVAPSGLTTASDAIVLDLPSGSATTYRFPIAGTGSGLPYAVALSTTAVFTAGTGLRLGHSYYAAGYQLAAPTAPPWFDDAPLGGIEQTIDTRGVAVVGNARAYGCGYSPLRAVVRAYTPSTGARLWEMKATKWPDQGECFAITADASHVFFVGTDGSENLGGGNLLVVSLKATTGANEWAVHDVPGSALAVKHEGDRLIVGATSRLRVYEAICSVHGVDTPCP